MQKMTPIITLKRQRNAEFIMIQIIISRTGKKKISEHWEKKKIEARWLIPKY